MAKRTVLVDDMEESGEVEADAGTLTFAFEGTAFEIDLSTKNATKFRSQMAPWMAKARKSGRASAPVKRTAGSVVRQHGGGAPSGYNTDQLNAIRDWARTQGLQVSDKGRVPGDILLAYEQAHAAPATAKAATGN